MADLEFTVDYDQLKRANLEAEKLGSTAQKSGAIFERAFNKATAVQRKSLTETRKLVDFQTRMSKQREKEARDVQRIADAQARSLKAQANEVDRLASKYNPLYKVSKLYERELQEIEAAHQVNAITAKQHQLAVDQLTKEYQDFQNGMASATNRFRGAMVGSTRSLSDFGMATQQFGYQAGDFLVQIQSGTNWMVAFGQQATQLVGVLPMLSGTLGMSAGKLVAISSGLGIAIPLITAIGAAWMRTSKEQDKANESLSELEEQIKSIDSTLAEWVTTKKASEAGLSVEEFFGTKSLKQAEEDLQSAIKAFDKLADVSLAPGMQNVFMARQLRKELEAQKAAQEEVTKAEERLRDIRSKINEEFVSDNREILSGLQEQIWLEQSKTRYGEESLEYLRLEQTLRMGNLRATLEQEAAVAGVTKEEQNLIDAILRAQEASDSFQRGLLKGRELAEALRSAVGGIDFSSANNGASTLIARLSQAYNIALKIAEKESARRSVEYMDLEFNAAAYGGAQASMRQQLDKRDPVTGRQFDLPKAKSGGSGGGGKAKETVQDYLKGLTDEIDKKKSLIGLFGEERSIMERVLDLKEQASQKELKINESELKAIALRESAVEKSLKRQEELHSKVTGSIESSMMSLVDRTTTVGDAFNNMINSILSEVYRQAIVKPISENIGGGITKFLGGLLPFAQGGAFSKGKVIPFAKGGVVNSPTTFPMRGATGLMGEAGPEAIMPLRRTSSGALGVALANQESKGITLHMTVNTPDVQGFQRSRTQIAAGLQRSLGVAGRNG